MISGRRGMLRRSRCLAALIGLACAAARGAVLPRVEARLGDERHLQFLAIGVRALAVGDAQRKLAVAFAAGRPLSACLLDLDARGDLATGMPLPLPMPEVGGRKGVTGEPVAVRFHPRKPLLYLWRRQGVNAANVSPFDHLVVFDVANPQAIGVVTTACSGAAYQSDLLPSALALDARARRLYLPNLQLPQDRKTALGYLALDERGLPVVRAGGEPAVTIASTAATHGIHRWPSGNGLVALGDRILLAAGWRGALYWDTNNRLAAMNGVAFPALPRDVVLLTASERWIYAASQGADGLACIRHVNGYPTLLPQSHRLPHANFQSAPVLMTGRSPALALAGKHRLYLVGLTPEGDFSANDRTLEVAWLSEGAPLAYSAQADRLYLPVEGWP
jgi:hypothetical protein